jgi:hypothetical protein
MSRHYLLIITALRAGEGSDLARAESGDYGGLVPVEDVAARFAPLPKGHDRAPLVDYQASLNLYSHLRAVPQKNFLWDHRDTEAIVPESSPAPGSQGAPPHP